MGASLWMAARLFAADTTSAPEMTSPPEGGIVRLPATVVTATRVSEDPSILPYSVSLVTAEDLERQLPRTTPEALRELPSILLQKTSPGQGSPYLRGFTGYRTLMLVDGIRLNNSTFRDGPNQYWNTVDAGSVDRLEVVRGPSSVMYGSDAVGGTVNAITQGRDDYGAGFDWDGSVSYRYASAESSHIGRPELSAQKDRRLGLHIGGSVKAFGEIRAGDAVGLQPKTDYGEWDLDAKIEYYVAPNSKLAFGHQTVRLDDAWRTHSTLHAIPWSGTTVGTDLERYFDQRRDLDYLQYHAEHLEGIVQELHVSVSHHGQGEEENRQRANSTRQVQSVNVNTLGVSIHLASPGPVGRWVYGAEYYHDWVDSSYQAYNAAGALTDVRVQGPVADDASYDLAGAFMESRIPLANDRWLVTLGGRYTHAAVDANRIRDPASGETFALSDDWDNLVGSGRVLCQLDAAGRWTAYAGASQAFRAPNLSDLTRWDADWGQEIPAPGVAPEEYLSLEVGARLQHERLSAEVVYFHTLFDDMIVRVPTGQMAGTIPVVTKQNSGKGDVHGLELSGRVELHADWTLWANLTWMRGDLSTPAVAGGPEVTEPMSRLMPTTVNAGLRWQHPGGRFRSELVGSFAETQDRLASNDKLDTQRIPPGGTPGYAVWHLRASWNPYRDWTLSAAVENFTDEDYRIHGSGFNEPGRNFILMTSLRF